MYFPFSMLLVNFGLVTFGFGSLFTPRFSLGLNSLMFLMSTLLRETVKEKHNPIGYKQCFLSLLNFLITLKLNVLKVFILFTKTKFPFQYQF